MKKPRKRIKDIGCLNVGIDSRGHIVKMKPRKKVVRACECGHGTIFHAIKGKGICLANATDWSWSNCPCKAYTPKKGARNAK